MIRLSRVGREHAIAYAIMALELRGQFKMFTKGEICRKMGVRSTSRIRDILNGMVESGQLVYGTTKPNGSVDEVAIYGLPVYIQTPLPDRTILINKVAHLFQPEGWLENHE